MFPQRPFLVVCRAGDASLHPAWFTDDREFDLVIDAYGEDPARYEGTCDRLFTGLAPRAFSAFHRLFTEHPAFLDYEAVWLPSDDIATDTATINALFRLHKDTGFALAQPALTLDSYFSHSITVRHEGLSIREVNMVEGMAPIFSGEALKLCLESFSHSGSGCGIDNAWPFIIGSTGGQLAVYDCLPVHHTRPVGGGYSPDARDLIGQDIQRAHSRYRLHPSLLSHTVVRAWDAQFAALAAGELTSALLRGFPASSQQGHDPGDSYLLRLFALQAGLAQLVV